MLCGGWPRWVLLVVWTAAAGLWIAATCRPGQVEASRPPPTDAPAVAKPRLKKPTHIAVVASADKLDRLFGRIGYNLDSVRTPERPVPRLILASVPEDLGDLPETEVRKGVLLPLMLPLIGRSSCRA